MPTTTLSTTPRVHPAAEVRECRLGAYCEVGARTQLLEVALGDYSYVVNVSDAAYATIGKFCSIAAMTRINPGNHPMDRASQSHFSYRASAYFAGEADDAEFFAWRRAHRVTIGHDVWIGHGAIILPGRTIDNGAVIAAGAVVTKDVVPYGIVAGNPARFIRARFSPGGIGATNACGRRYRTFRDFQSTAFSIGTRRRTPRCETVHSGLQHEHNSAS